VVNPQIVSVGGKPLTLTEGCLSFPGIHEPIARPFSVVVTAQNLRGEQAMFEASHWFGRIVQHEIDHLDGRLMMDHLGPTVRRSVDKRIQKFQKAVMADSKKK
jgi:peptide deformylase